MNDFNRLLSLLKPEKTRVIFSIICTALTAVFTLVSIPLIMPFFQILFNTQDGADLKNINGFEAELKNFFESLIKNYQPNKALMIICTAIILSFFLKNLFRYLSFYFMAPVRSNIMSNLRDQLFSSYLSLHSAKIKKNKTGDLITRISADVQEVEYSILQFIQTLIQSPLIIIGSLAFMLFINIKLTLIVFGLLLFIAFVMGNISKTLKKDSVQLQSSLSDIVSTTEESLFGWLSINVFNASGFWKNRFEKHNQNYRKRFIKFLNRRELSSPLSELMGIIVVVVLLALGSIMVLGENMAPETFFAFILAFYFVIEPAKSFSSAFYQLKRGSTALQRIEEFTQLVESPKETHSNNLDSIDLIKEIKFENVYFKFDDSQEYLLKNINFTINAKTLTALIGPSGSGKTSLAFLLMKIYTPTKGRISINGKDLQEINTHDWRDLIGFVSQEPFLFNDTIATNVLFGRSSGDDSLLWESLKEAYAEDLVKEKSLDYLVGEKGNYLSGGQKQRITIARALYNDPQLIIMDEPTSALDPIAEKNVSVSMNNAIQNRTAIIVAHSLNTIKKADQIILLENGEIGIIGTHDYLSSESNLYQEYLKYQSL